MKLPWRSAVQSNGPAFSRKRLVFLLSVVLALWTILVFSRLLQAGFNNYDDPVFVMENLRVQAGPTWENVKWAFSTLYFGFYFPLTWLSLMFDSRLFGLWAGGYHLTNLLLHASNAVMLLLALVRMTKSVWRSAFVAALFALHPLHVESVAWISERKDVLSTFFLMLTFLAYAWYAESPSVRRYMPVAVFFTLGLMAKSMIVTAPVLLLLLDFWPLERWRGDGEGRGACARAWRSLILEKLPLFALSGLFAALTILSNVHLDLVTLDRIPLGIRLENALVACGSYLAKAAVPVGLALAYPYKVGGLPLGQVALSALLLLAMAALGVLWLKERPYVFVGLAWFIAGLFPVIGIIQVGPQASADRYTYVPLVGIFLAVTWGLSDLVSASKRARGLLAAAALSSLAILSGLTWVQTGYWKDSITLFGHALDVTENNALAHSLLGAGLNQMGDDRRAKAHLEEAIRLWPHDPDPWGNLGEVFMKEGMYQQAETCFMKVLQTNPRDPRPMVDLALLAEKQGRMDEAITHYDRILKLRPRDGQAWYNRGLALQKMGRRDEALASYREAILDSPSLFGAHLQMGRMLLEEGRVEAARTYLKRALELAPGSREAQMLLRTASERTP